jgi:hypothetical protein
MFVLLIPVLLGMVAMAVDLGAFSSHRRSLQNSADAIALAAAQELPDEAAAEERALAWAKTYYDLDPADLTIVTQPVSSTNPNPSVSVTIDHDHDFHFMPVLGIDSAPVDAHATAVKTSPGGLGQVVPWAILESTKDAADAGDKVTLKYDAGDSTNGNFGAIRLDGNGSSVYGDSIENGSSSVICADGVDGCEETSPVCEGSVCQSESGNMIGSTRKGVDYRIENTDAHCDTFGEVFFEDDGDYGLNPDCNPWIDGSYESLRVIVVPLIDELCNGSCSVTITGFSLFWLDGYGDAKCSGSSCTIVGRFINADITLGALIGNYDPNASVHYTRLVE